VIESYRQDLSNGTRCVKNGALVCAGYSFLLYFVSVVNNGYYFKRFLSSVYIVNSDTSIVTSIGIGPLCLTIMLDPK
jgi:hypothetical protein